MMTQEQKLQYGVEITLPQPDSFLLCKETLTRLGIKSKKSNILYQSAHILHKRGLYYIISFKELFLLDGKEADFTDDDFRRRNTIAKLLNQWGICKIVDMNTVELVVPISDIAIIPFKEKKNYELISKYTVGSRKRISRT
jgi:Bacteriophage translational regulator